MPGPDPRAPVIVGVGQITDHASELSPSDLMLEAIARATGDAGPGGQSLINGIGSIGVIDSMSWPAGDPGGALAEMLGVAPVETAKTLLGGNSSTAMLGDTCERIQAGHIDSAVIVGAEAMNPLIKLVRQGVPTGWPDPPTGEPDRVIGKNLDASHQSELAAGLMLPINYYPLFENAIRASAGLPLEGYGERLGRLWARFSGVASRNPHAWARDFPSAEEIAGDGSGNRMVSFPYRKLMTANINVDQGAALILCSVSAAEAAGISRDLWVFPHAVAGAHDHWLVGERDALDRSPAIAACGREVLTHSSLGIDDMTHLDLYSCFPSAVQVAAAELGFDLEGDREPTVTGGLTFAGGPASNYVTHSLAAMAERLRAVPGSHGLVTAVGWYLTKHGVAMLSSEPPSKPFGLLDPQSEVDALPRRDIASGEGGAAELESYTVAYGGDGSPTTGTIACLMPDGRRAFAKTEAADVIAGMLDADPIGLPVQLDGSGGFAFA